MASRIVPFQPPVTASKKTRPVKHKDYLAWLHELPCVITGTTPVEAAHISTANLSYGHLGRGKGRKSSDRWAVPLSPEKHAEQGRQNEVGFWRGHGIDPYIIALTIYGLYQDLGDDATDIAQQIIRGRRIGR